MNRIRVAKGFTLIELMIVVAIVGILTTVAMPTFQRLTLRSKAAERIEIMNRVKIAVADYYVQHGTTRLPDGITQLAGTFQPATSPGTTKLMPNFKDPADGWIQIFKTSEEIEGALYYQYRFVTDDSTSPATLTIQSMGDLDGDGLPSTWTTQYERRDGSYRPILEDHPENDIF